MSQSGASGDAGEVGFNVVTPAFPATTVKVTNTNGFSVDIIFLTAGTTTVYTITDALGTTQSVTAVITAGQIIRLGPKEQISITFSAAPTWKWKGVAPF